MNDRIKDLMEQSTYDCTVFGEGFSGPTIVRKLRPEKFAELIVRECAQRCEDIAIKHQVEETTYAAGKKAGAFECATDLRQHFGIEK